MRSSELARLAGVTVRALRHYHQVGVLREPERGLNGYRRYDVHDLIRVLRIRRLASIGVPLDQMADLLDGAGDSQGLLETLDAELAAQIDRLAGQRDVIARFRGLDTSLDVPPELARFLTGHHSSDLPPDLADANRDQTILLAHLAGEHGLPELTRLYERLVEPEFAAPAAALTERLTHLGPHSTEQDIADLVDDFVAAYGELIDEFGGSELLNELGKPGGLVEQHTTDILTPEQRVFLARLQERLDGGSSA